MALQIPHSCPTTAPGVRLKLVQECRKAVFKFHNFANRTHHRYYLRNIFSAMYGIVGPMGRPNQITTFHATTIPIGSRKFSLPGQK